MRVDANLQGTGVKELAAEARGREANGYDGLWTTEKDHDPFLPLMPLQWVRRHRAPTPATHPRANGNSSCHSTTQVPQSQLLGQFIGPNSGMEGAPIALLDRSV